MGAPIRYEILQLAYLRSKISCALPKVPHWQLSIQGRRATSRKTTSRPCFFHSSDTQFELRHGRRCLCQLGPRDCHTKTSWKSVCPKTDLYGTLLRAILASHRTLLVENMASNTSSYKSIFHKLWKRRVPFHRNFKWRIPNLVKMKCTQIILPRVIWSIKAYDIQAAHFAWCASIDFGNQHLPYCVHICRYCSARARCCKLIQSVQVRLCTPMAGQAGQK